MKWTNQASDFLKWCTIRHPASYKLDKACVSTRWKGAWLIELLVFMVGIGFGFYWTGSSANMKPEFVKNSSILLANEHIVRFHRITGMRYYAGHEFINIRSVHAQTRDSKLQIMVPVLNSQDPQHDINIIKPYLRSGDIFVFPIKQYKYAVNLSKEVPGLRLATGGTSVKHLISGIPRIPTSIGFITYDYERGHTPEWSRDQATSIRYFDRLDKVAKASGKKLIIAPAWVFNPNFDWGEIAKHTDILVVQVQNFQTNAKVPDIIKPSRLGISLTDVTRLIVSEVRDKSPGTRIFLQFGFDVTNNPDDIIADINAVKGLGINGVTLWYNAHTSADSSKIDLLQKLLSKLDR